MITIEVESHPALAVGAFETHFDQALGELPSPDWLVALLSAEATAPVERTELVRTEIRDLLRHGGYKPTGRGKPASEYLVKAALDGRLTSINRAVDTCNVVSLHSGLPISLIDLELAQPPLRVALVTADERYVFNAAGQEIRLPGLLCLWDAAGPCANGVKDSQRTKTSDQTRRTLSIVWGARALGDHTSHAVAWYRELCERLGATTEPARLAQQEPKKA